MSPRAGSPIAATSAGAPAEARSGIPVSSAETPRERTGPTVSPPREVAGGLPAIVSTMKHSLGQMGVTRTARTLRSLNQKGGFDCPSCAWPDPEGARSVAEFCENGAKAVADEATTARITPEFFRTHGIEQLGEQSDLWLGQQGRLTAPMVLRGDRSHYEPISWDDAFALVAGELQGLASPNEAVFYTSGRTSNEAAFLYQLFARQFGTNNMPDCSNMCHESSGSALGPTIGIGKGTVRLDDFPRAQAIFLFGQNPGTNHPRMLTALREAKRAGATIVSVNPLAEADLKRFQHPQDVLDMLPGGGTALADLFLPVRIHGDMALLQGVMKEMLEEERLHPGTALDQTFIAERTSGFDDFAAALETVSWDDITAGSGIARDQIRLAADILMKSERTIACWAMGLTQHRNAVGTIRDVLNMLLLRGSIGKPGSGVCPVRGHSNVQGDRTMGVWERPDERFLSALDREFEFRSPRDHGLDTVASIVAMHEGRAKVLVALGGNFLSAAPDTRYAAEALGRCSLTVHVSTKLNRSHVVPGRQALILPCLGRTERDMQRSGEQIVSTENSMGVVQSSRGRLEPASSDLRSEPWIVARLARTVLGSASSVPWDDLAANYDRVREHIERVVPGFAGYNERLRAPGGFELPNGPRDGSFPTPDGKAHFSVNTLDPTPLEPDQLVLMTIRSHDQFNTTIYGLDDRYRGIFGGRRVILLNRDDMAARGLKSGDLVDVTSHFQGERRRWNAVSVVPYDIPRGNAAAYFPEANVLVPIGSVAEGSRTPTSKFIVITLEASAPGKGTSP